MIASFAGSELSQCSRMPNAFVVAFPMWNTYAEGASTLRYPRPRARRHQSTSSQ